jgi:hypothetical protein
MGKALGGLTATALATCFTIGASAVPATAVISGQDVPQVLTTHAPLIPRSPTDGLPSDWVSRGSGQFETSDPQDLLSYQVEIGAVDQSVVEFRLQATRRCLWGKTLVMPDGKGSSWDININPAAGRFSATNGLWAHQVRNGQNLELWKAGTFGIYYKVLEIGDLGALPAGSRVVFTWLRDSWSCGP